jgi:hypothetical protein
MRDYRHQHGLSEEERRRVIGCAFSAAVVAAPFIALFYSRGIGLGVLAVALGSTVYFAVEALREAGLGERRRQLLALLVVNAAFLTVVVLLLALLLFG